MRHLNLEDLALNKVPDIAELSSDNQMAFMTGMQLGLTLVQNDLLLSLELNRFRHTQALTEILERISYLLEEKA